MKNTSTKLTRIIPILLTALIVAAAVRVGWLVIPKKSDKADTAPGVSYITRLEAIDPADAENSVRAARELRAQQNQPAEPPETQQPDSEQKPEDTDTPDTDELPKPEQETEKRDYTPKQQEILDDIENGNFDHACQDILFFGDSLVKAIEAFEVLDSSQVIAEIGGGAYYLSENIDAIIDWNPKYLVIHIGENDVDTQERAPYFAESYADSLRVLKEYLPETLIIVDSIFPVEDFAVEREPYLVDVEYYNEYLAEMAENMNVRYINYTPIFASFDKYYYDHDGVHPVAEFYYEQYLPIILKEIYLNNE